MTIARNAVRPISLPSEAVLVPEIGGEVLVQGMNMPQLMEFMAERRRIGRPRDGEDQDAAAQRAVAALMPHVLAWCVVLDDGDGVYSVAEWGAFGARHSDAAMGLFSRAMRLSGHDVEAEKKA